MGKTYEDVIKQGGRLIAGVCTNTEARPVLGAIVNVYGEKVIEGGRCVVHTDATQKTAEKL